MDLSRWECPHGVSWIRVCTDCKDATIEQELVQETPPRMSHHLDDTHYILLGEYQPKRVLADWALNGKWQPQYIYRISEAVQAVARHELKGNPARDLRKAAQFLNEVADEMANLGGTKP